MAQTELGHRAVSRSGISCGSPSRNKKNVAGYLDRMFAQHEEFRYCGTVERFESGYARNLGDSGQRIHQRRSGVARVIAGCGIKTQRDTVLPKGIWEKP